MPNKKLNEIFLMCAVILAWSMSAKSFAAHEANWYVTANGGVYQPNEESWEFYYGSDYAPDFGMAVHYQPWRMFSAGISAQYIQDHGEGDARLNSDAAGEPIKAGNSRINLYPVSIEGMFHASFSDDQLFVPYASLGWTYMGYQGKVSGNPDVVKGNTTGSIWRLGIKWLLDGVDPKNARKLYNNFGIDNSYLLLEYGQINAEEKDTDTTIDLGGSMITLGYGVQF